MKDILLQIIGLYVPDNTVSGIGSLDIPWIFGALMFTCLICVTAWFACRIIVGILHD